MSVTDVTSRIQQIQSQLAMLQPVTLDRRRPAFSSALSRGQRRRRRAAGTDRATPTA